MPIHWDESDASLAPDKRTVATAGESAGAQRGGPVEADSRGGPGRVLPSALPS